MVVLAASVAVVAGMASVVGAGVLLGHQGPGRAWSGRPLAIPRLAGLTSFGRARTEAQLVDFASLAAAAAPGPRPDPHQWVFVKTEYADSAKGSGGFLFGPPSERFIGLQWIRVDWRQFAVLSGTPPIRASLSPRTVINGQLTISPGGGGTLCGWKSVSYRYLNSLPATPAALESVILGEDTPQAPCYTISGPAAVFNAIATLLNGQAEGVVIPPRLAATMYQVLQILPGVHFDSATDLAGRTGLGFYMVLDGWYKKELVINPVTYAFMGEKTVAITAHEIMATDGRRHIGKGQVLGWYALLQEAIVALPGQLPQ